MHVWQGVPRKGVQSTSTEVPPCAAFATSCSLRLRAVLRIVRYTAQRDDTPLPLARLASKRVLRVVFSALHFVIVEDQTVEAAVLGEHAGLRGDGLRGENTTYGG